MKEKRIGDLTKTDVVAFCGTQRFCRDCPLLCLCLCMPNSVNTKIWVPENDDEKILIPDKLR